MSVKITGLNELINKLDKLEKNLSKEVLNNILNNIGVSLTGEIKNNFHKSVDPYGKGWDGLKLGGRYKKGIGIDKSAKPLLDTGKLVNSINFNVKQNILEIGTPLFYAEYHQNGSGVKQREFLPNGSLPDSWNKNIFIIIDKVLKDLV